MFKASLAYKLSFRTARVVSRRNPVLKNPKKKKKKGKSGQHDGPLGPVSTTNHANCCDTGQQSDLGVLCGLSFQGRSQSVHADL